ncbi:MAG TPA: 7-cyano-7-deazaguanine synthase [Thermoanaerobaculia bacterium]|nr:7-cyano-7-deazaguanine synthase [Thermoanaerobaculia bacterium]
MKINIVCDDHPTRELPQSIRLQEPVLRLSTDPRLGNVYFAPEAVEKALGARLDPVSLDLCEIASYVYLADKALPRGQYEKWTRNLSFLVPVREPARWRSVQSLLMNTISTLTDDNVEFHFVPKRKAEKRPKRPPRSEPESAPSDCVSLFSGGLDSFAGAVHLIRQGRRPLFASHYVSVLKSLQGELKATLDVEFGQTFEHLQYRVTARTTKQTLFPIAAKESSHRARSFLFMSFAAMAAATRNLSEIFICENGVLSLNVPISDARKGARSTRHAHPLYLRYFSELINGLYGRSFQVRNPFRFWTKGEEARLLAESGLTSTIRKTVSCWGYPNQTLRYKDSNHCGTCLPCIVRRVALIAAGLEAFDDRYIKDVFNLDQGASDDDRRNIQDLVYFCQSFLHLSKTELLYRYPELVMIEVGEDDSRGDKLERIIWVYRRFAQEVLAISCERSPQLLRPGLATRPSIHLSAGAEPDSEFGSSVHCA